METRRNDHYIYRGFEKFQYYDRYDEEDKMWVHVQITCQRELREEDIIRDETDIVPETGRFRIVGTRNSIKDREEDSIRDRKDLIREREEEFIYE